MALNTRGFRAPRLNMKPGRYAESVALDQDMVQESGPAFIPWHTFASSFTYSQGEHCTLVGTTGSGKTTLARELLLPQRDYVVVLGTKSEDDSLYEPLLAQGYVITDKFNPAPRDNDPTKIIFRPTLLEPTREAMRAQSDAFRQCLTAVFQHGRWAVYGDEIRYLTDNLGLAPETEVLWLQGRSLKVSMLAATQRPVSIPLLAFDQATHLFLWRNTDRYNVQRMSEFAGADVNTVRHIIPRLPRYEFLYIDTRTGDMARSKVVL